ncbi:neuronal acetylcholine receptor subunit beta-3 [Elysia marginata]|uniref:Neuronal acetylcholine receptor subunit beta-3 n=1 Tax=Elysia marginata TaxID=1093978 RepID=A0AAV4HBB2_9GAST|nr:neuronal acetylcholine receptor subunit beta-3 [Elysia marginata]
MIMYTALRILSIGFLLPFRFLVIAQTYNQTAELMQNLFNRYNKNIRPVLNQSNAIDVITTIRLRNIEHMSEKDQTITLSTVIVMEWADDLLTWNPSEYGNITLINPGADMTWLPPLNLDGMMSDKQLLVDTSLVTPLTVRYNGSVLWFTNVRLIKACMMDMTYFPNDEHSCQWPIHFHTYAAHQVKIILRSLSVNEGKFIQNVEYELFPEPLTLLRYRDGLQDYEVILLSFKIRRHPQMFVINLMFPTVALSFLNILVFVLPADSGEKGGPR